MSQYSKMRYVIGIDEVGRGCLAGEVTVGAVAIPQELRIGNKELSKRSLPLRDSKRLTRRQREIWFRYIKNHEHIVYAVASVSQKTIDTINIRQATDRAATRALSRLLATHELRIEDCKIFLDGGLLIRGLNAKRSKLKAVTHGDQKIPAIMLASIVAKVIRDCRMRLRHKNYPAYAFLTNVGYGTPEHIKAIKKNGPISLHRLTFIKKYLRVTLSN